ncbi:MAG: phosphoglucosamine mutase [Fibrobacter sp.]|nr:phosphoglucosamine mutase [Fibrobacter sp.]
MAELPIMSVSGIRGVVGKTIDPYFVSRIAFIQTKISGGGKVIVGRDTRNSGAMLAEAAFRGIRAAGGTPVDLGIAPTPTTCLCTSSLGGSTGIIITASHNPGQYNGYKMVHSTGRLFRADECQRVYKQFLNGEYPSNEELEKAEASAESSVDGAEIHVGKILSRIDAEAIKTANIHIAVDSINGAGGAVFPLLLEKLGVKWSGVHNKLDGDFVHNPEPRPEHLGDLSNLLKSTPGNWGGFVFDPDADRLATMGENGEEISEEMTLVFALQNLLQREKSDVATNLSTSMLIDDVASKFGVKVYRSKIGEANVVETMGKNNCRYGGEGNGGVIYPEITNARDGLTGMALILELMAKTGKRLTEIASAWPRYAIVKEKIECSGIDPASIIGKLEKKFSGEHTDNLDGLKIIRDYGWVHLRASNTEPIIRCYAEARSEKQARELADMVLEIAKCS